MSGLYPNGTAIDPQDCTLSTCPLSMAHLEYLPSLWANCTAAGIFGISIVIQLFLGIKYKTWGYMAGMLCGLALEAFGYFERIQMHSNPFKKMPFVLQLVGLTVGPAFLTFSIYLCLGRIIVVYGQQISRISPRIYTIVFMFCDFTSLVLQSAGGAIASSADDQAGTDEGVHIMIAGLIAQVVSLTIFAGLCLEFGVQVRKQRYGLNSDYAELRSTLLWKCYLAGLICAVVTIYIRSSFRVAELWGGFRSSLANNQVAFMIFEPCMLIIAVACLTAFHTGVGFQGHWQEANFTMGGSKKSLKKSHARGSTGFELLNRDGSTSSLHPV